MNFKDVDQSRVAQMYNEMDEIWPDDDKWYKYTHEYIIKYIGSFQHFKTLNKNSKILNLGSGGNEYEITGSHYHVDIAKEKICRCKNYFVTSAEKLPFKNDFFDAGVCVGSVINYCDPFAVIHEISRTLKKGSYFILDFEQSESWQFIGTQDYKSDVSLVASFNSGYNDKLWIFSLSYITNILSDFSFEIINLERFHLLSPLLYKIIHNENKAAKLSILDPLAKKIGFLKNKSYNIILTVQKV